MEIFKNIKKLDVKSHQDIAPFYDVPRLDKPVFFHSIYEMLLLRNFYYTVVDGCLVVFRVVNFYGKRTFIVYFTPISLNGNIDDEKLLCGELSEMGFTLRYTESEAQRLNLRVDDYYGKYFDEFIYSVKEFTEMKGSEYSKIRNLVNRFNKEGGTVEDGVGLFVEDFMKNWMKQKDFGYNIYKTIVENIHSPFMTNTTLYLDNNIEGFGCVEKCGRFYNALILVANIYSKINMNPALYFHCLNRLDSDSLMSTGCSFSEPLDLTKRNLCPKYREKVYRCKPLVSRPELQESFINQQNGKV